MKIGLKTKFISLSIVVGIFVFLSFFYTFTFVQGLLQEKETESAENVLSVLDTEINKILSGYENDIRLISNLDVVQDVSQVKAELDAGLVDEEVFQEKVAEINQVFLTFAKEKRDYFQIRYIDKNGQEVARVDRAGKSFPARIIAPEDLQDKSDRDYFQKTIALSAGIVFVSEMDLNIENGEIQVPYQPVIRLATPVFDRQNQNQGIVIVNIFADSILNVFKESPYKNTYLLDQDGYFLYKPDEEDKEWSRSLGTEFRYDEYSNRKNYFSSAFRVANFLSTEPVFQQKDNLQFYYKIDYTSINPEKYWVAVSKVKLADSLSSYTELRDKIFFINLLATLFAIAIFSFFITYFTRPIKYLQQAVEYLNMGRFDLELPVFSKDEFGEFTKKINFLSKKIRENENEKYEFIKSASHQLRTPASSMRFQLDLLKEDFQNKRGGAKVIKALDDIETDLDRSVVVVNDLLKYVEIGDNYFATNLSRINIREMIDEIMRIFDEEIFRKKLKVTIEVSKSIIIEVDELRIKDAFTYLINNAIQYSIEKGEVLIFAERRENEIYFEISDNGIGIPKKEQLRVFEKFFRASNAYSKKGVGSGLGLVIARNIIKGHGGKLQFESRENKGTKFYFSIFDSK